MDDILSYERKPTDDYYFIMGCTESASKEQILAEFKTRVLDVHPDKNPGDPKAEERFKTLQLAKDVLTDPDMRKKYDVWCNSGISMPFDSWMSLSRNMHTSLHWASCTRKDLMLEGADGDVKAQSPVKPLREMPSNVIGVRWEREPANPVLQRFRNYEI